MDNLHQPLRPRASSDGGNSSRFWRSSRQSDPDYEKLTRELNVLMKDHRLKQEHQQLYDGQIQSFDRNAQNTTKQDLIPSLTSLKNEIKKHIEDEQKKLQQPWSQSFQETARELKASKDEINSKYNHLIDTNNQVTRSILDSRIATAEGHIDSITKLLGENFKKIGEVAISPEHIENMNKTLSAFKTATQDVQNFLNDLQEIDIQQKSELHKQYEQLKRKVKVLISDFRIDQFNNKTQDDINGWYNQTVQKFEGGNKSTEEYKLVNENIESVRQQMEKHIGEVKIPEYVQNLQQSFDRINKNLEILNTEIENHNHLDTREDANSKVAERVLQSRRKSADNAKQKFASIREDFGKIGEVSIGPEHIEKMTQALADFQTATDDVQNFLDGLKEIDFLKKRKDLAEQSQIGQREFAVLTSDFRTFKLTEGPIQDQTKRILVLINDPEGLIHNDIKEAQDQIKQNSQNLNTYTTEKGQAAQQDSENFIRRSLTSSSEQTNKSIQEYEQAVTGLKNFNDGLKNNINEWAEATQTDQTSLLEHFNEIASRLEISNQKIDESSSRYEYLIDKDENSYDLMSKNVLDYRKNNAETAKNELQSLIDDFGKIGEVPINPDHYNKLQIARTTFEAATQDVKSFQENLQEIVQNEEQIATIQRNLSPRDRRLQASSGSATSQASETETIFEPDKINKLRHGNARDAAKYYINEAEKKFNGFIEKIQFYLPRIGINEKLSEVVLHYRANQVQKAIEGCRKLYTNRNHEVVKLASKKIQLALGELERFKGDLDLIGPPERIKHAQKQFDSLKQWFDENSEHLVDDTAWAYTQRRNYAQESLDHARQFNEQYSNTGEMQEYDNFMQQFNSTVSNAEKGVEQYAQFQKKLENQLIAPLEEEAEEYQ